MKVLKTLHLIIDLFFLLILLNVILYSIVIIPDLINPNINFEFFINKYESLGKKAVYILGLFLRVANFVLFFIALFNIRMIVSRFMYGFNYDLKTRKYFKVAGWSTLIYGLIKFFLEDYWDSFLGEKGFSILSFNREFHGFGSYLFIIILGLFFIYIAKVLEKSDELQKENELTI